MRQRQYFFEETSTGLHITMIGKITLISGGFIMIMIIAMYLGFFGEFGLSKNDYLVMGGIFILELPLLYVFGTKKIDHNQPEN